MICLSQDGQDAFEAKQIRAVSTRSRSTRSLHTFVIQRQHVEPQSTGLLADVAVNVLRARLMDGDGVLEGLHAGLQAERQLGVTHRVPGEGRQERSAGN